ncbi:hypothetical protein SAMN05444157_0757 [Frankineae bacterium MT45]|nr:hypothetical protein SAMN05444157_0757 [Frankineae bacterium MT45]
MTYELDAQAASEAAARSLPTWELTNLAVAVRESARHLGPEGVGGDATTYSVSAWSSALTALPPTMTSGCISRSDVFTIAAEVSLGTRSPVDLFTASYLWGQGTKGYGRSRYDAIVSAAGNRLEPALTQALAAARTDIIDGYAHLVGGYFDDVTPRAAALQPPWGRLPGYGPAFFTKFLYFGAPGGLILDNVVASRVYSLSVMPHLVTTRYAALAWTPYRYAVYLHWMNQMTAALAPLTGEVKVTADLLEVTLASQGQLSAGRRDTESADWAEGEAAS